MATSLLPQTISLTPRSSGRHYVNIPPSDKLYQWIDVAVGLGALLGVFIITNFRHLPGGANEFLALRVTVKNVLLLCIFSLIWSSSYRFFGLYNRRRLNTRREEITSIIKACSVGSIFVLLFPLSRLSGAFSFPAVLYFWLTAVILSIFSRVVIKSLIVVPRKLLYSRSGGVNRRHVLIVGTNQRAVDFAQRIESKPELGYQIIGYADDKWESGEKIQPVNGRLVTSLSGIDKFLRDRVVDEAVICLPAKSYYSQIADILDLCRAQGIIARLPTSYFDAPLARSSVETFEGESMTTFYCGSMNGKHVHVKRCIDIVLSSILLTLLLPVFPIIALLIKLTSSGPILFTKPMLGLNKRRFTILKFRSMAHGADDMSQFSHLNNEVGPGFKIKNDPRVTRFGKFLRKTSVDELPQLINVLKGEMSLVGPRPLSPWEYDRIQDQYVIRRFSVKPGITGLWQVSGRSDISFDDRIKLDLHYIDNWNLLFDLRLLCRTLPVVLSGKGSV